jgi:hypothetical protein
MLILSSNSTRTFMSQYTTDRQRRRSKNSGRAVGRRSASLGCGRTDGVVDIHATLARENMSDYFKVEFVLVCSTMWEVIIAPNVDRVGLPQAESVAERGTDVYMLEQSDRDRYHDQVKSLHVEDNEAHPTKRVETLDEIHVQYNTIDIANGD